MQLRDALSVGCIALSTGFVSISSPDKREILKVLDDELRKRHIHAT